MLDNLTLKQKLILLVGVALAALLIVAAEGIYNLQHSRETLEEIARVRLPAIEGLGMVREGQTAIRAENRRVSQYLARASKPADYAAVRQEKSEIWKRIDKGWNLYEPLRKTREEAALWEQLKKEWRDWKSLDDKLNGEIAQFEKTESEEARQTMKGKFLDELDAARPLFATASDTLSKLMELNIKIAEEEADDAEADNKSAMTLMSAVSILAVLGLGILGSLIATRILTALGGEPALAKSAAESIAAGDLTHNLPLRGGDTHSLMAYQQSMLNSLRTTVRDVTHSVSRTEEAAQLLAGTSQQVAAASGEASESAASMAAAVEEMSVSISQVSDNAREALSIAERAGELSANGGRVIEQAVIEINHIAETVRATANDIATLSESSHQISSVVQVIKDVADQTNLLALNAAIEAARAGEAGRGFAVVADEVRKLAERTTGATGEISAMIGKIQGNTQSSVAAMENAVSQVNTGVNLAGEAGAAIHEIRESVDRVVAVVNDIVNSIREQSIASQQIAQRVEQVAQSSEENNSAAQQTAESAKALRGLAGDLRASINRFRA